MLPTTMEMMNTDAPRSSPIANENVLLLNAEKVENTSGEPLPKARKVTPAVDSPIPSRSATVARLGQKKSDAEMPIVAKRNAVLRAGG
jgi:hypothetical protein